MNGHTEISVDPETVAAPFSLVSPRPIARDHAVQFYDTDESLCDSVAEFLCDGISAGERVLVIASEAHRVRLAQRFRVHFETARLPSTARDPVFVDADECIAELLVDGMPDREAFGALIRRLVLETDRAGSKRPLRVYGEMVDILWQRGNEPAALRLEDLWNDAGHEHSFMLLCAYLMDNFATDAEGTQFHHVCQRHSHVIPTERVERVDERARSLEVARLEQRARRLEREVARREALEVALREALSERAEVERALQEALCREQEARARAESSARFKEIFLAVLGHDLRNPLNTVLATARIMGMRGEVQPEARHRLDRIVSSGSRMARMIDQIMDVARARLAGGIALGERSEHDVATLVARIADEIRAAHPTREIRTELEAASFARVDVVRLEQVLSNLLGNAVTHGDPVRPIEVQIAKNELELTIRVHNFGPAIEPSFMPFLFDPFQRDKPCIGSSGLGLGLYISQRIVAAHGGEIRVRSSSEAGTCFEVVLPRET